MNVNIPIRTTPNVARIVGWVFVCSGLLMLVIGTIVFINQSKKLTYYEPTTATIVRIESHRNSEGSQSEQPYLNYEAGGKEYRDVPSTIQSGSMHEGDTLSIAYDPNDPETIILTDGVYTHLASYVLWGIGVVHLAFGVLFVHLTRPKKEPDVEPGSEYLV